MYLLARPVLLARGCDVISQFEIRLVCHGMQNVGSNYYVFVDSDIHVANFDFWHIKIKTKVTMLHVPSNAFSCDSAFTRFFPS